MPNENRWTDSVAIWRKVKRGKVEEFWYCRRPPHRTVHWYQTPNTPLTFYLFIFSDAKNISLYIACQSITSNSFQKKKKLKLKSQK
ncbi:Uncharacterized protein TCM_043140 [Theobroma cacao]|uniref:Uncharacterized protein n=1 Tax=Theobroma cacao TaxID=3641 RepID=A0A061FNK1_THECC|nr:Uncharacterized protein TCM_043140 [Theobroma cacao]